MGNYNQNENGYNPYGSDTGNSYNPYGNNTGNSYNPYGSSDSYNYYGNNQDGNGYDPYANNAANSYHSYGNNGDGSYNPYGSDGADAYNSYGNNSTGGYDQYGSDGYHHDDQYGDNGFHTYDGNRSAGNGYPNSPYYHTASSTSSNEDIKSLVIMRSYIVMLASLLITGFAAAITSNTIMHSQTAMINYLNSFTFIIFIELALGLGAQRAVAKKNLMVASVLYVGYTIVTGITFAVIFMVYDLESVKEVFIITAMLFGIMAAIGHVTKRDLTTMGSYLSMALIGMLLVTVMNVLFIKSSGMDLMVDYVVVFIFIGLTAYDTQKMKRMAMTASESDINILALYCGMDIYLDFINLFLRLLSIMGKRRR